MVSGENIRKGNKSKNKVAKEIDNDEAEEIQVNFKIRGEHAIKTYNGVKRLAMSFNKIGGMAFLYQRANQLLLEEYPELKGEKYNALRRDFNQYLKDQRTGRRKPGERAAYQAFSTDSS